MQVSRVNLYLVRPLETTSQTRNPAVSGWLGLGCELTGSGLDCSHLALE